MSQSKENYILYTYLVDQAEHTGVAEKKADIKNLEVVLVTMAYTCTEKNLRKYGHVY